jgi:hypothetical protein
MRAIGVLLIVLALLAVVIYFFMLAFMAPYTLHKRKALQLRPKALQITQNRAAPIIQALYAYTSDYERPPEKLERLRPKYIKRIPDPGPLAYNGWHYRTTSDGFTGGWALYVFVEKRYAPHWLSFGDVYVYHPSNRYRREAYGGILEPMGRWGYYNE